MTTSNPVTVTNSAGHVFRLRVVRPGDRVMNANVGDTVFWDGPQMLVEIYDAMSVGFGPLGAMVASYYLDSLADRLAEIEGNDGLRLRLSLPRWTIDGPALEAVRALVVELAAE